MAYIPRVIDAQLDDYLTGTRAISIEGPRAVGKTLTASRRSRSIVRLDDPAVRSITAADRIGYLASLHPPVLIDEWQLDPPIWDAVRRMVDDEPITGRFLLTGSANPGDTRLHSGSGRFLRLRMRPLSFAERGLQAPTISLATLWNRTQEITGQSDVTLRDYADEIVNSGFPAARTEPSAVRLDTIADYVSYAIEHEVFLLSGAERRPTELRAWLRAYAAATSNTTSLQSIAAAVSPAELPNKATILKYRDTLSRLWLIDELPAWVGAGTGVKQLSKQPKHQLADPALAASLLGTDADGLVTAQGPGDSEETLRTLRNGPLLGALFESLVTLSLQVYAAPLRLEVSHLRTHRGDHEIDLILQGRDGGVIAVECKLAAAADDHDVKHLNWLKNNLGDRLIERIVVTTGAHAYRRPDGVAVIPLALLGP